MKTYNSLRHCAAEKHELRVQCRQLDSVAHPLSLGRFGASRVHLQKLGNVGGSSSVGQASQQFQER